MTKLRQIYRDKVFLLSILVPIIFWFVLLDYFNLSTKLIISWIFFVNVLFYPLLEELVFRGLIQEYLRRIFHYQYGYLSLANLLTSLLFTLIHWLIYQNLLLLLVFIPSLLFGYFKDKYHSIKPAIYLHIFYNLGFHYFGITVII